MRTPVLLKMLPVFVLVWLFFYRYLELREWLIWGGVGLAVLVVAQMIALMGAVREGEKGERQFVRGGVDLDPSMRTTLAALRGDGPRLDEDGQPLPEKRAIPEGYEMPWRAEPAPAQTKYRPGDE